MRIRTVVHSMRNGIQQKNLRTEDSDDDDDYYFNDGDDVDYDG